MSRAWMLVALAGGGLMMLMSAGCAGKSAKSVGEGASSGGGSSAGTSAGGGASGGAAPGTLAYDKDVWHSLLGDHAKIRRTVKLTATGVEATTESDDPAVAAKIKDHALAMQKRVKLGAPVRVWDPVFVDLFKNHDKIRLEVHETATGVSIVEASDDPEVVVLLHSHASGVSDFVRQGFDASARETPYVRMANVTSGDAKAASTLVAVGGVAHRFDRARPDGAGLAAYRDQGVKTVVSFCKPSETPDFDEGAAVQGLGMAFVNIPYQGDAELTDEVFDRARETIKGLKEPAALHCRSGNRVGAVWLAYRVLDCGMGWDAALVEAKAVGLSNEKLEAKAKDYVKRRGGGA